MTRLSPVTATDPGALRARRAAGGRRPMSRQTALVPITWDELLQADHRKLRRSLATRYRAAVDQARAAEYARERVGSLRWASHGYFYAPDIYIPGEDPFDDSPARIAERRRGLIQADAEWKASGGGSVRLGKKRGEG